MAWTYKITLTVDHTQCGSADSSSFVALVSLTNALLKVTGSGGQITHTGTQSGGNAVTMPFDLIFTSDSAGTTKIPWEIESYVTTTGALIAWVKVATLSHTADTVFYGWFGDSSVTTQQNTGSLSPANVYVNYTAAYLLPDGTTLSGVDSTSNANNLTKINTPTATTGQIDGGALLVAASSQELRITSDLTTAAMTFECWVKANSFPNSYNTPMSANGSTSGYFDMYIKSNGKIAIYILGTTTGTGYDGTGSNTLSTGIWYHLAASYDSSAGLVGYLNGASDGTAGAQGAIAALVGTAYFELGQQTRFSPRYFDGVIDNALVSNVARSASYVLARYNNQKSGSTFLSASFAAQSSFVLKQWESMSGGTQNLTGGMNG